MQIRNFIKNPANPKYREYLFYYFKYSFYLMKQKSLNFAQAKYIQKKPRHLKNNFFYNTLRFLRHLPVMLPVVKIYMFFQAIRNKYKWIKRRMDVYLATKDKNIKSPVDTYWTGHTVCMGQFKTAKESEENLAWRFSWYPKFKELMDLYGDHKKETILDYGCGPGNDVVGFSLYSKAEKIIGMDISPTALELARERLDLHKEVDPKKVELIKISDKKPDLPLKSNSIDYIYSGGVLHHVTDLPPILKELKRVLKPGGHINIMVYNYNSIYLHLFIAYQVMIVEQRFPGLNLKQAFAKSTDGENCPISICYPPEKFLEIGQKVGFECQFLGGYWSVTEQDCLQNIYDQALSDSRLAEEHKNFLKKLTYDKDKIPMYEGKYAGIGGVYRFYKK